MVAELHRLLALEPDKARQKGRTYPLVNGAATGEIGFEWTIKVPHAWTLMKMAISEHGRSSIKLKQTCGHGSYFPLVASADLFIS